MIKRYDPQKDEEVEVTQEWFDNYVKSNRELALDYKENDPISFKKFYDKVIENA